MIVVFDLDGVLADNSHRLPYMLRHDYASLYSYDEVMGDSTIEDGFKLLAALRRDEIYFVTGRPETCRRATTEWLRKNKVEFSDDHLRMRKKGDYRKSPVVKLELVEVIFKEKEDMSPFGGEERRGLFIDDDPNNVVAISEAFPGMTGIVFGIGRLSELRKKESSFSFL